MRGEAEHIGRRGASRAQLSESGVARGLAELAAIRMTEERVVQEARHRLASEQTSETNLHVFTDTLFSSALDAELAHATPQGYPREAERLRRTLAMPRRSLECSSDASRLVIA